MMRVVFIEIKETGVSLGRRSPQCRQWTAILLQQLWHGCQVRVKMSAQLPPTASIIQHTRAVHTGLLAQWRCQGKSSGCWLTSATAYAGKAPCREYKAVATCTLRHDVTHEITEIVVTGRVSESPQTPNEVGDRAPPGLAGKA